MARYTKASDLKTLEEIGKEFHPQNQDWFSITEFGNISNALELRFRTKKQLQTLRDTVVTYYSDCKDQLDRNGTEWTRFNSILSGITVMIDTLLYDDCEEEYE